MLKIIVLLFAAVYGQIIGRNQTNLPSGARHSLAATSLNDRYILFGGGRAGSYSQQSTDIWDIQTRSWLPSPGILWGVKRAHKAVSLGNTAFFGPDQYNAAVDTWSTTNPTWTTIPTYPVIRADSQTAFSNGKKVLFCCGSNGSYQKNGAVWDIDWGNWTILNFPLGMAEAAAATIQGVSYVVGGRIVGVVNPPTYLSNKVYIYSYNDTYPSGLWTISSYTLPQAQSAMVGMTVNDTWAVFAGGYNYASVATDVVVTFHAASGRWMTSFLQAARVSHAGVAVGRFAVVAGGASPSSVYLSSIEVWDSDTNLWAISSFNLSIARGNMGFAAVGKFVLFGGGYTGTHTNRVDILEMNLDWKCPMCASCENFVLL
jgi:hypothetical protein